MKTILLMIFGMMAAVGLWATITLLLAKAIAFVLRYYGLGDEWSLVPLLIGILLACAAFVSSNPIVIGAKP